MEELYWMAASSAESSGLAMRRTWAAAGAGRATMTESKWSDCMPAETTQPPASG